MDYLYRMVSEIVAPRTSTPESGTASRLYRIVFALALITIGYNLLEGLFSIFLGYEGGSLALFGFGADSFIEVVSGFGIAHMVLRVSQKPHSNRDRFERTALKITGYSFYVLVTGLVVTSIYNIVTGHTPQTTFWGVVVSLISIVVMWALIIGKTRAGKQLSSEAILADAACTRVCIYMSVIVLLSSGIYEISGFTYADSIGTLCLSYFAFTEGKECFEKAKSNDLCCCKSK